MLKKFFKQRTIIFLIIFVLLALSFSGCNQDVKSAAVEEENTENKNYKIGILSGLDYLAGTVDGFKDEMTKLGYIEGENVTYDIQKTNSDPEEYKAFSKKFADDKVDLIFGFPTEAAIDLQKATKGTDIPVVFAITNIEGTDIVENVKKPGGNITGVRYPGPDLALKRVDAMLEIVPDAKTILLPFSDIPVVYPQLEALRKYSEEIGVKFIEAPAKTPDDFKKIFEDYKTSKEIDFDAIVSIAEAFTVVPDTFLAMIKFANENKIPTGGALMDVEGYASVYGVNIDTKITGQKAAGLADKILKGENPGDISVLSDDNFTEINLKEAQKQGLEIPETLLNQASKIIK